MAFTENDFMELRAASDYIDKELEAIRSGTKTRDEASIAIGNALRIVCNQTAILIYRRDFPEEANRLGNVYELLQKAEKYISGVTRYNVLQTVTDFVSGTASHRMPIHDEGTRITLYCLDSLVAISDLVKREFGIVILSSLGDYPLDMDNAFKQYYESVISLMDKKAEWDEETKDGDAYYINRQKTIRINGRSLYELTLSPGNDYRSKFNHFVVFSDRRIPDYYAIEADFQSGYLLVDGKRVEIKFLTRWRVSIRPCEIQHYCALIGISTSIDRGYTAYQRLMDWLTRTGSSLLRIVDMPDDRFEATIKPIVGTTKNNPLERMFRTIRHYSKNFKKGFQTLRYLMVHMDNVLIKKQRVDPNGKTLNMFNPDLFLASGCYPFEKAPFFCNPRDHNSLFLDLCQSVLGGKREGEKLARAIRSHSDSTNRLFYPIAGSGITQEDVKRLVNEFNDLQVLGESIGEFENHLYLEATYLSLANIIGKATGLLSHSYPDIDLILKNYLESPIAPVFDDPEKERLIKTLFQSSCVAAIYGPAGTGKTKTLSYICEMFAKETKIIVANTNVALEHLRKECPARNAVYRTASSLANSWSVQECDLLIIDESSTIDSRDMSRLLNNVNCKASVFAGDYFQLDSIGFGPWFRYLEKFLPETSKYVLQNKFRTTDPDLVRLWDSVRNCDGKTMAFLNKNHYSRRFDEGTLLNEFSSTKDEIVLCLNYDGVYGINNLNRRLQVSNPSTPIKWKQGTHKVDDPILFIDNHRFKGVLDNNLKGRIKNVAVDSEKIVFTLEVEKRIDLPKALLRDMELNVIQADSNKSIVSFPIYKNKEYGEEGVKTAKCIVPFQIAYAISIHKAQGLEYDSVKIVVANDIEEQITSNVLYTAITRAKRKLAIYWSPETETKILKSLQKERIDDDIARYRRLVDAKKHS